MNIADKLKTITLKKKEAYLYDFINYIDIIETNRISTLAVNTKYQLLINPSFLDSLNDDEIIGCLYHELLHIKYKHLETKKTNHYLVNIAGDIFINEELLSLNYVLPHTLTKQTYLIPDYIYTAEDIYRWLEDNLSYDEKTKLFELNESEINNFDFDNVEMPGELEEILKKFDENYKSKLIKKQKIKEEEPIKWDI
jgi:predicted metal-dependent peptidase